MSIGVNNNIPTTGLKILLDGASPKSALHRKQSSNLLVDPHGWGAGNGGQSGFGANGDATEQSHALRTDPWGGTSMTWRSTPDAVSGADGGWNTSSYTIDRNYTYRFSVWVKRYTSNTGGTFYLGMNPAPIRNDNNTVQGNPYWYCPNIGSLTQDQWFLVVGHCFYEGYSGGGPHPDSGWWTTTGGKVNSASYGACNCGANDVRWDSSTTSALHRVYHYYTTDVNSGLEWAFPRMDKCDGSEPSIYQLLKQGEGMWNDLSGNGNHGVFANHQNVTWSSDYGGVFTFDANTTYSYIDVNGPNLSTSDYTVIGASRYNGAGSNSRGRIISAKSNNWLLGHWGGANEAHYAEGWITSSTAGNGDNNWRIYAATGDYSADQRSFWVNGSKIYNNSTAGSQGPNGFQLGRFYSNSTEFSNGQIGYLAAWDRVLTDDEIIQVTNALRGRYGL